MPCKAIFRKAILTACMAAVMAFNSRVNATETPVKASCMAESPTDGSVWIGSEGHGLYRLGRNGRQVVYTAKDGQIASDSIRTLFFDKENVLWILDGSGKFTTYSATSGFQITNIGNDRIDCATYDEKSGTVYFSSGKKLNTYKNISKKTSELATLPAEAKSLKMAENGAEFVWVFTEKGAMKVGLDGTIQNWIDTPNVLDLLPYNFETNQTPSGLEGQKESKQRGGFLWVFIALVAGLTAGWLLKKRPSTPVPQTRPEIKEPVKPVVPIQPVESVIIKAEPVKRQEEEIKPQEEVVPQVEEVSPQEEPEQHVEEPAKPQIELIKPKVEEVKTEANTRTPKGHFTKKVYALIKDHLSEPDFDVESIATLTGISRIHVNRKLRQEGAPAPSALIKEARMHHAARLIRQGKLGMSQISALCGFRTPSYFATAFKEFYGVSPSEFTEEK